MITENFCQNFNFTIRVLTNSNPSYRHNFDTKTDTVQPEVIDTHTTFGSFWISAFADQFARYSVLSNVSCRVYFEPFTKFL